MPSETETESRPSDSGRRRRKHTSVRRKKKKKDPESPKRSWFNRMVTVLFWTGIAGIIFLVYNGTMSLHIERKNQGGKFSLGHYLSFGKKEKVNSSPKDVPQDLSRHFFDPPNVNLPVSHTTTGETAPPIPNELKMIRIATWNLSPLDFDKITDPERVQKIVAILRLFDVVAIQGIRCRNDSVMNTLLYCLKKEGAEYSSMTSPSYSSQEERVAFVYNRRRVEMDTQSPFEMRLSGSAGTPPLISASFRATVVPVETAFTFTLVNVSFNTRTTREQRNLLVEAFRTVKNRSGRNGIPEDDIILLGSYDVPVFELGKLTTLPRLVAIHRNKATTLGGLACDNMIFDRDAVTEYLERYGTINLAERFSIDPKEAKRIADHYPVWADFSASEVQPH